MNRKRSGLKRFFERLLGFSVALVVLVYVLDWAALEIRMQQKTAYGSVPVDQFLLTPLKGQKEEFDFMGTKEQSCVKSIFPHASAPACWWVERHKTEWEQ
jgi:hypothetical protein